MNPRGLLASWFAPLWIHNHNQQTAAIRAAAAKAQGLDPNVYGVPLPGSNVTSTVNQSARGFLPGAIVTALALAGGGAGALGLREGLGRIPPAVAQPAQPAPAQAWDAVTEEQQPDGSWKQIRREHLKP
jgi:hypothetical protein